MTIFDFTYGALCISGKISKCFRVSFKRDEFTGKRREESRGEEPPPCFQHLWVGFDSLLFLLTLQSITLLQLMSDSRHFWPETMLLFVLWICSSLRFTMRVVARPNLNVPRCLTAKSPNSWNMAEPGLPACCFWLFRLKPETWRMKTCRTTRLCYAIRGVFTVLRSFIFTKV